MTLPKGYNPNTRSEDSNNGSSNNNSSSGGGGGKKAILWIGLIIIFGSTLLGLPLWLAWIGAGMVIIGLYYIIRGRNKERSRKKSLIITFGIVGVTMLTLVIVTTLSLRGAVEEVRETDRQIQALIGQTSPHPDVDIGWYYDIEICKGEIELGNYALHEVGCDANTLIERAHIGCQVYNNEPLYCNPNTWLGQDVLTYIQMVS